MKTIVTVIYYEQKGKKFYVSELSTRDWDQKLIVTYSEKIQDARQYENDDDAQTKIDRIVNHCNRQFKTEPFETKLSRRNPFTPKAQDAFIS